MRHPASAALIPDLIPASRTLRGYSRAAVGDMPSTPLVIYWWCAESQRTATSRGLVVHVGWLVENRAHDCVGGHPAAVAYVQPPATCSTSLPHSTPLWCAVHNFITIRWRVRCVHHAGVHHACVHHACVHHAWCSRCTVLRGAEMRARARLPRMVNLIMQLMMRMHPMRCSRCAAPGRAGPTI